MNTLGILITFVVSVAGLFEPAASTSLDQIKTQCVQRCALFTSLSGHIRIFMEAASNKINITSNTHGTYEQLRREGSLLVRCELTSTVTQETNGRTKSDESTLLTISDGRFTHTLSTQPKKPPSATRTLTMPSQTVLADAAFLDGLGRDHHIRVLPDETLDKTEVWVLEAIPKNPARAFIAKTIYYIAKDTGIRIRSTGHDSTGRRIQLTEFTEIKLDPPIKPNRFVFKAPAGVSIVDLTPSR